MVDLSVRWMWIVRWSLGCGWDVDVEPGDDPDREVWVCGSWLLVDRVHCRSCLLVDQSRSLKGSWLVVTVDQSRSLEGPWVSSGRSDERIGWW